jgi:putative oxidoreductase
MGRVVTIIASLIIGERGMLTNFKPHQFALNLGRILLATYFIFPGVAKFVSWQTHIDLMHHHKIPFAEPLLFLAGVANFVFGGLLIANFQLRLAAYGCVMYILIVNFNLHDFWNFEGLERSHETQNFVKNLGIMSGCLMLAGYAEKLEKDGK